MKRHAQRFLESGQQEITLQETAQLPGASSGDTWEINILAFGRSKRSPHFIYTKEAADRSLGVFKGAKVYALRNSDDFGHAKNAGSKSTRDIVGVITEAWTTENELKGKLKLLPSASWLKENLAFADAQKIPMPYELSIDAGGRASNTSDGPRVDEFLHASVDVVEQGAAGGKILKMVASLTHSQGGTPMKNKIAFLFSLLYPTFLEAKKVDLPKIDENELYTYLREADKATPRMSLPDGDKPTEEILDAAIAKVRESLEKAGDGSKPFLERLDALMKESASKNKSTDKSDKITLDEATAKRLTEAEDQLKGIRLQGAAVMLESKLQESKLPAPMRDLVKKQFAGRIVESKEIDDAIKDLRDTVTKMVQTTPDNRGLDIHITKESIDKVEGGVVGFFMTKALKPLNDKEMKEATGGVAPMRSIKEAYIALTGDEHVTGERSKATRLSESLGTSDWTNVISTAMNKRMVADYGMMALDTWRAFVDVTPLNDFKQQQRLRFGGYPNLPIRPAGAAYQPLASPTDEKATYSPSTRGGTEDITREMIMNDDVASVQKIPTRMARAAAQTLHEFVYDFIKPSVNPTIYDSVVLYHAGSHANTGTAALDATGLAAARLRMKKQTQKDNAKRLGLRAGFLIVPADLESTAYGLLTPAYSKNNTVPDFLQQVGITAIVVDYWTDATDWVLAARREDILGLEIGFVNGAETPEMFVSDLTNVGSFFTNDKITYKIRHEYGGAITDYRAFDGEIVA